MARKSAASIAVPASTLRIQAGSAPQAEKSNPAKVMNNAIPQTRRTGPRVRSWKHFNLHLLGPDVVGNIFRGHGQFVRSRHRLFGDDQLSYVAACARIPIQRDRRNALQSCDQGAGALRSARLQIYRLAGMIAFAIEPDLNHWRLAGDDESL